MDRRQEGEKPSCYRSNQLWKQIAPKVRLTHSQAMAFRAARNQREGEDYGRLTAGTARQSVQARR